MTRPAPNDRVYTPDHLWAAADGDALRVGVTPWFTALRPDDVTALHLPPIGTLLQTATPAGSLETSKATLDLFAPCDGAVVAHNPVVLADPALCVRDPWNAWLWRMTSASTASLWDAARYLTFVESRR